MKDKGDFSTWWYWALLIEERKWGPHALQAEDVRAEIARRNKIWKMAGIWLTIAAVLIGAIWKIGAWLISN
jgi:hypothetical protein